MTPDTLSLASLSLRRLQIFDTVVTTGSAGAAARALGLSQPAVTHALARLEAQLGHRLLERGPGGTAATPTGCILHRRVARLRSQFAAALGAADGERRAGAMTATQVQCHVAIAEHGTFSAAAQALGISLPALQRTARGFEQLVGAPLYRRLLRHVGVTPAGETLARGLRVAATELAQARAEIAAATGQGGGRIAVGCLPLMPKPLLAGACNAALALHPDLLIALTENSYDLLLRELRDGRIDLVIGALRQDCAPDIAAVPLFDDPYVVLARATHPLAGTTPEVAALRRCDWVAAPAGTPRRAALERLFAGRPAPRVVLETNSVTMMLAALMQSDVLAVTARSLAAAASGTANLAVLGLAAAGAGRRVGYTTRAGWLPTAAQADFLACLERLGAALRRDSPPG